MAKVCKLQIVMWDEATEGLTNCGNYQEGCRSGAESISEKMYEQIRQQTQCGLKSLSPT